MPVPTPFHERTSALCSSLFWKDWAGCHAVRSFDTCHEREYYAIRHAAGLLDVSPLFKYDVRGPDAAAFLARVMVRDITRLRRGRVAYVCWCDDRGRVVDDGTVARLGEERFRVTAAEPSLGWFERMRREERIELVDVTRSIGALALQGPTSRDILDSAVDDADVSRLRYFRVTAGRIAGVPVEVSRTGYTGDLGYEVWVPAGDALRVWDAVVEAGRPYRLEPAGLDALDVARVEAGYIMNGVDYFSANHCMVASRTSSPDELGLDWMVDLDRGPFVGHDAIVAERARGPAWRLMGLEYDWDEYEALWAEHDLPPHVPSAAWRDPVPVYDGDGRQVGQATSGAWSPMLKRNLALAHVRTPSVGGPLRIEATVEYGRHAVRAHPVRLPFFAPPRARALA